jgi:fumarate reductase subunit C
MTFKLYALQRLTALVLVPLLLVHLFVIFYATAKGLSAASILGRTRGSVGWGAFYSLFVAAAAVHGAIGLHNVFAEWAPSTIKQSPRALTLVLWGSGTLLAALGLRAVYAVVLA